MRLAYLYSRYPVLSQTFCDMEMLELERRGFDLVIGSVHPPLTSLRHEHISRLRAPIQYAPPAPVMRVWEKKAKASGRWPQGLIDQHERKFGHGFKAALRARNACYFAQLFEWNGIEHVHVHFANRAAHTAIFLKAISGIPFSITAHGQDFMSDLGDDRLLREICAAAEFVAVETDYSRKLLQKSCPEAAAKIHCVYNGMDFTAFRAMTPKPVTATEPVRIVSVGRLVEFKGFQHLIEACGQLRDRGLRFLCEVIGDGPWHCQLQRQIEQLKLENNVILRGAVTQAKVFEALRSCDIFALASTVDRAGASDVFPTVIQEAMASARPIISTRLAGIPETVVDGATGLLVPHGDVDALSDALQRLIGDPALCTQFGGAGQVRIEKNFQIGATIEPLIKLLPKASSSPKRSRVSQSEPPRIAYLIDVWPDPRLLNLRTELREMERRQIAIAPFVFRMPEDSRLTAATEELAARLEFLPDALAVEAEWQAHRELAHRLESDRALREHRPPADLFLEQSRFAIALLRTLRQRGIQHVHATSSRSLLCGLALRKLLGTTLSVSVENKPRLSAAVLREALRECVGGRIARSGLTSGDGFLPERRGLGAMGLTGTDKFWQEWAKRLTSWAQQRPIASGNVPS